MAKLLALVGAIVGVVALLAGTLADPGYALGETDAMPLTACDPLAVSGFDPIACLTTSDTTPPPGGEAGDGDGEEPVTDPSPTEPGGTPEPSGEAPAATAPVHATTAPAPSDASNAQTSSAGGALVPPADSSSVVAADNPMPAEPKTLFGHAQSLADPSAVAPVAAATVAIPAVATDGASPIAVGPRSTLELFARLAPLGLDSVAVARLVAPFPVAGVAAYGDDFGQARTSPVPHIHQGVDIRAAAGTPVVAAGAGTVRLSKDGSAADPDGGNAVRLTMADGSFFYYAHLLEFAPGLATGTTVAQGQILGSVGATGDATGPHLHFEIHPGGGEAVDPVPSLDRWLAQANGTALGLGSTPASARAALSRLLSDRPLNTAGVPTARRRDARTTLASAARAVPSRPMSDPVPLVAVVGFGLMLAVRRLRSRAERPAGKAGDRRDAIGT